MAYKIEHVGNNVCVVRPKRWWAELSARDLSAALVELSVGNRIISVIRRMGSWFLAEYLVVVEKV